MWIALILDKTNYLRYGLFRWGCLLPPQEGNILSNKCLSLEHMTSALIP